VDTLVKVLAAQDKYVRVFWSNGIVCCFCSITMTAADVNIHERSQVGNMVCL